MEWLVDLTHLNCLLQKGQHRVDARPSSSKNHHVLGIDRAFVGGVVIIRNCLLEHGMTPRLGIKPILKSHVHRAWKLGAAVFCQGHRERETLTPRVGASSRGVHVMTKGIFKLVKCLVDTHWWDIVAQEGRVFFC